VKAEDENDDSSEDVEEEGLENGLAQHVEGFAHAELQLRGELVARHPLSAGNDQGG